MKRRLQLDSLSDRIVPTNYNWVPPVNTDHLFSTPGNWKYDNGVTANEHPANGDSIDLVVGTTSLIFDIAWNGDQEGGTTESHYSSDITINENVTFSSAALFNSTVTIVVGKKLTLGTTDDETRNAFICSTIFNKTGNGTMLRNTVSLKGIVYMENISQAPIQFNVDTTIEASAIAQLGQLGTEHAGVIANVSNAKISVYGGLYFGLDSLLHREAGNDSTFLDVYPSGSLNAVATTGDATVDIPTIIDGGTINTINGGALNFTMPWNYGNTAGPDLIVTAYGVSNPSVNLSDGGGLGGHRFEFYHTTIRLSGDETITIAADTFMSNCTVNFKEVTDQYPTVLFQDGIATFGSNNTISMHANFDGGGTDLWDAFKFMFDTTAPTITVSCVSLYEIPGTLTVAAGINATGFGLSLPNGFYRWESQDGEELGIEGPNGMGG